VYTLGKDNSRADALSRQHDIARTKEIINTAILKVNKDGLLGLAKTLNLLIKVTYDEVLEELQEAIIKQHHDNPLHGHPSITRTIELIRRNYEFPNIKDKVTSFIAKCADC
jgi:hypothetical protein